MKTAKEFLNDEDYYQVINNKYTQSAMIGFAKYHVQEALKQASEKIDSEDCFRYSSERNVTDKVEQDILNAYPFDNIK